MIRILFDELGDSHNDIFLKVDAMPSFLKVADSYFLREFLSEDFKSKEEVILSYINYFKNQIQELAKERIFIAFDLSDQYLGGLFVTNNQKGLIKVEYGWNKEMAAWAVSQELIENQVKENIKDFRIERDWLLSKETVVEGLNWSIEKLKKLPKSTSKLP